MLLDHIRKDKYKEAKYYMRTFNKKISAANNDDIQLIEAIVNNTWFTIPDFIKNLIDEGFIPNGSTQIKGI